MSSKNFHWYNNGIKEVNAKECPEGYVLGRLKISEETRKKMSDSSWIKKLSKEELLNRNLKISKTIQSRTLEEKLEYSQKISNSRKGKGTGKTPWNKNLHIEVWNKNLPMSEEQKQKLRDVYNNLSQEEKNRRKEIVSKTHKNKTPWNKGLTYSLSKDVVHQMKIKENETKKLNHSYITSKIEDKVYQTLLSCIDKELIFRQHLTEKYSFNSDFYISILDLYIEINGNWTHGFMPYTESNEDCIKQLNEWIERSKESDYYKNALYTWTDLDVRKRQTALRNKLNYIVIYPNKTLEENISYCYNNTIDNEIFYSLLSLIYKSTQE